MEEINNFQQEPDETIYQAYERFKELLMKYPQHYLTEMQEEEVRKTSEGRPAIQEQLNYLGREIKKVNEKVYAAQVGCEQCKGPHYTKDFLLKEEGKTLEEDLLSRYMVDSFKERRQSMEDTLSKFMGELAKRHEENSNLIKEIRALTDAAIRNQGASIKTLRDKTGRKMKHRYTGRGGCGSLPSSTKTNLRGQVKSISTTIDADSHSIRRIGSPQYAVPTGQNRTLMYETKQMTIPFPSYLNGYYCDGKKGSYGPQFLEAYSKASQIDESIPQKEKDPGSFTLPCFINNVCFNNALIDVGVSVSVMPLLTYFNLGLWELAHTKLTVELVDMTVKYPKGIAENVLVRIGALMNVLIFVGTFSVMTDFVVLEDMDAYRDEGLGDVSKKDEKNGILHAYQKLKEFYKGVLNLGPDYIQNAKTEEWLTRGHISVHEME
ncbi:mitochondrial proton/calcium exchanger protein-like protein isoform X1 [Tanacetum coccineum]